MITTPKNSRVVGAVATLGAISVLPIAVFWNDKTAGVTASGDTGGDSFGLVFGSLTVLVIVAIVLVNVSLHFLLKGYPGAVRLVPKPRLDAKRAAMDCAILGILVLLAWLMMRFVHDGDAGFVIPALALCYVVIVVRASKYAQWQRHHSMAG